MQLIGGVDEAGRGPLAGAVYAAAVILDPLRPIVGLKDSKQISAKQREQLEVRIMACALAYAVGSASVAEIDQLNILQASLLAMQRAVDMLSIVPHEVWVDGLHVPQLSIPALAIVRGDTLQPVISAASILAKTARDRSMLQLHERYPHYGFDRHKGYPTAMHMVALKRYGATPEHRSSFAPVKKLRSNFNNDNT